ncbi:hypothetical protein PR202_ga08719 [Eleusine coracana subsp. coracana]|uniref:Exocyst subunit Exo70 family protein n=1 Tax=Eleusine coracana subsp. coracana TaxID=191504 RepID=A0AAV5C3G4_ELECO|nr:hypothetical protein PR202_ga08719 [Eleusine coracana subsp. coracana]
MLQWNRSPGSNSGIWDANGNCTNGGLLAVVDEVLLLAEEDPFPAESSSDRRKLDSVVAFAVFRMMEEFRRVRVWNSSQLLADVNLQPLACLPSADERGNSSSTGYTTSTTSTGGDIYASDGSRFRVSRSDEVAILMDGEFLDEIDLICPAGVSVLHEIAQRVIRAGGTEEFLQAFATAPCDVLDSFLPIRPWEHFCWTTARWSAVTKFIESAVLAMRRQLYAQPSGAFDSFRDEYLLSVAEWRILVLLDFADNFTRVTAHEKLVDTLTVYEALCDAAPGLLLLFSGTSKQLVPERTQGILTKLADVIRTMASGLMARVQNDSFQIPHAIVGVHPLTWYTMACVKDLAPRSA